MNTARKCICDYPRNRSKGEPDSDPNYPSWIRVNIMCLNQPQTKRDIPPCPSFGENNLGNGENIICYRENVLTYGRERNGAYYDWTKNICKCAPGFDCQIDAINGIEVKQLAPHKLRKERWFRCKAVIDHHYEVHRGAYDLEFGYRHCRPNETYQIRLYNKANLKNTFLYCYCAREFERTQSAIIPDSTNRNLATYNYTCGRRHAVAIRGFCEPFENCREIKYEPYGSDRGNERYLDFNDVLCDCKNDDPDTTNICLMNNSLSTKKRDLFSCRPLVLEKPEYFLTPVRGEYDEKGYRHCSPNETFKHELFYKDNLKDTLINCYCAVEFQRVLMRDSDSHDPNLVWKNYTCGKHVWKRIKRNCNLFDECREVKYRPYGFDRSNEKYVDEDTTLCVCIEDSFRSCRKNYTESKGDFLDIYSCSPPEGEYTCRVNETYKEVYYDGEILWDTRLFCKCPGYFSRRVVNDASNKKMKTEIHICGSPLNREIPICEDMNICEKHIYKPFGFKNPLEKYLDKQTTECWCPVENVTQSQGCVRITKDEKYETEVRCVIPNPEGIHPCLEGEKWKDEYYNGSVLLNTTLHCKCGGDFEKRGGPIVNTNPDKSSSKDGLKEKRFFCGSRKPKIELECNVDEICKEEWYRPYGIYQPNRTYLNDIKSPCACRWHKHSSYPNCKNINTRNEKDNSVVHEYRCKNTTCGVIKGKKEYCEVIQKQRVPGQVIQKNVHGPLKIKYRPSKIFSDCACILGKSVCKESENPSNHSIYNGADTKSTCHDIKANKSKWPVKPPN